MNATAKLTSIGMIGFGNMGSALAKGIRVKAPKLDMFIFNRGSAKKQHISDMGAFAAASATEVVTKASMIILAVKPYQISGILQEISPVLSANKCIISIAAGTTIAQMQEACGHKSPIARVMPNTLAKAGHGHFGICLDDPTLSEEQKQHIRQICRYLGATMEITEDKMNAYSALAGCGPAYVFYFMEALAEAGVSIGLSRSDSTSIAASLLEGSVALTRQEGEHYSILREQVCSPAGMTIAGINTLDKLSTRSAFIQAVIAAKKRGDEMGQ